MSYMENLGKTEYKALNLEGMKPSRSELVLNQLASHYCESVFKK